MKLFTLILSVLMTFPLTACDAGTAQPSDSSTPPPVPSAPETVETADSPTTVSYKVGDIILADGSVVKASDLVAVDENKPPMAVIAGFKEDGTAFGVGVHRSDGPLQWAPTGTPGNLTKFTEIVCTDATAGDTNGTDNWDAICSADAQGTRDASVNYPAFHFISTYAETYQLPENYASGWYMPSITELCTVYENRTAVNASLQTIYELDNSAAMDGLGTVWYWASSQSDSDDDYAWFVHYFNGYAACCPKDFDNLHVMAVRVF